MTAESHGSKFTSRSHADAIFGGSETHVRKRDDVERRQDGHGHSNTSVDVPFWEDEEEVLAFD
jgi:hypothetical protein